MSSLENHMTLIAGVLEGQSPARLDPLLVASKSADPQGLVYRNSSLLAATDALKSNYPATAAIMGDAFFAGLAHEFIAQDRPKTRSLVGYGEQLPDFISKATPEHGLPWLADFARLDRAWLEAHLARDALPMQSENIAAFAEDEEALFASRFELSPSARVIRIAWALFDLWARLRQGEAPPDRAYEVANTSEYILIMRPRADVAYRTIEKGEFALLRALKSGASLGASAEIALGQSPDLDVGRCLTNIIQDALFVAPEAEG